MFIMRGRFCQKVKTMIKLLENERIDDLQLNGLKIIQRPSEYCFSSDAVLLSSFVRATSNQTIVEFGCGNGVISLLLSAKTNANKIIGVELQESTAELARKNVLLNNLDSTIEIINHDVSQITQTISIESIDVVVTNPPYFASNSGQQKSCQQVAISRHESSSCIEQFIISANKILKYGGKFYMICKVQRMAEIITILSNNKLTPKKITLIYPKRNKTPDTFVIECKKGAKHNVLVDDLVVYNQDGSMTDSAKKLYNKI